MCNHQANYSLRHYYMLTGSSLQIHLLTYTFLLLQGSVSGPKNYCSDECDVKNRIVQSICALLQLYMHYG